MNGKPNDLGVILFYIEMRLKNVILNGAPAE